MGVTSLVPDWFAAAVNSAFPWAPSNAGGVPLGVTGRVLAGQIVPAIADQSHCIGSKSRFYRVLHQAGQCQRRGRARPPQAPRTVPCLRPDGPNQLWSWDITYLRQSHQQPLILHTDNGNAVAAGFREAIARRHSRIKARGAGCAAFVLPAEGQQ
jgi:hypothetical protein